MEKNWNSCMITLKDLDGLRVWSNYGAWDTEKKGLIHFIIRIVILRQHPPDRTPPYFCWVSNLLLRHLCHRLTKTSHSVTIDNFSTFLLAPLLSRNLCQSELSQRFSISFLGELRGRSFDFTGYFFLFFFLHKRF